jgi:photosystem II stability/assembly factor-like uncharacterized protein
MFKTVVTSSLLGAASAKSWSMTSMQQVTSVGGVYATSADTVYGSVTDNDSGPGMEKSSNGGQTSNFYGPFGMINTDIAFDQSGNGIVVYGGGLEITTSNGEFSKAENVGGFGQSAECVAESSFAAAGNYIMRGENVNGVALTKDAGQTWNVYDVTSLDRSEYPVRYGAYPSEETWYVSSGKWPVNAMKTKEVYDFSSRIRVSMDHSVNATRLQYNYDENAVADAGYFGAVAKTTDGGATWTNVLNAKGEGYFNEIHCADEDTCMVVGEGGGSSFAYLTKNGGATWNKVHEASDGSSLMGCKMLSTTEAWLSGGNMDYSTRKLVGYFWHTTDAGATWTLDTLDDALSMDLSFADGVGYSTATNERVASIATYQ